MPLFYGLQKLQIILSPLFLALTKSMYSLFYSVKEGNLLPRERFVSTLAINYSLVMAYMTTFYIYKNLCAYPLLPLILKRTVGGYSILLWLGV